MVWMWISRTIPSKQHEGQPDIPANQGVTADILQPYTSNSGVNDRSKPSTPCLEVVYNAPPGIPEIDAAP